ncbi:MAG: alpha-2-macroglobulin, partial [Pirellulaceae bacterium]|nr:alpha-2-macroglobulin [Pirellulaceae bacterium]
RLQYLSDIAELPDYSDGYPRYRTGLGAPVDEDGNPIYHQRVRQWQEAETDGQRWRWALDQVVENNPGQQNAMLWQFARFCQQQFGVQTMLESPGHFRGGMGMEIGGSGTDAPRESGAYQLHTLTDTETIARLASGIKRFDLPDEFNYIRIYEQLAGSQQGSYRRDAEDQLGYILENRRQFPRAADHWRAIIKDDPARVDDDAHHNLQQIVGDWGAIEPVQSQAAGQAVEFGFRFRNAKQVRFTAHQVHVDKLLADAKQYLLSNPRQFDWQKIQIQNLGWQMIEENQTQYIGEQVAQWSVDLEPRQNHFDRLVMIETPLDEGGAYLITSKTGSGNETKVVLWVDNTSIVRKQISGGNYYFLADARTGDPVPGL